MSTFLCESSVRSPVLSTDRFLYFFLLLERADTLERMFHCPSLDSVLMMIQDNYSDSSSTLFKRFSELVYLVVAIFHLTFTLLLLLLFLVVKRLEYP